MIGYKTFVLTAAHIRLLTGYITMLFNRTRARRAAGTVQKNAALDAFQGLLSDEQKLSEYAAKVTMDMINAGYPLRGMVTTQEAAEAIRRTIARYSNDEEEHRSYVQTVETMMAFSNESMLRGEWRVIGNTNPKKPFVIGHAPVVTWERTDDNILMFGQGRAVELVGGVTGPISGIPRPRAIRPTSGGASSILCKRPFFPCAAGYRGRGKVGILILDFEGVKHFV